MSVEKREIGATHISENKFSRIKTLVRQEGRRGDAGSPELEINYIC
jgi:hypothetical protein